MTQIRWLLDCQPFGKTPELRSDNLQPDPRRWGPCCGSVTLGSLYKRYASYVLSVEKKFHPVRLFGVFPRLSVPCSWKAEMYLLGTLQKQFKICFFCVSTSLKEKGQKIVSQIGTKHWYSFHCALLVGMNWKTIRSQCPENSQLGEPSALNILKSIHLKNIQV